MVRERAELRRWAPRLLAVLLAGLIPLGCNDEPAEDAPDSEADPGAEMDPEGEMELPEELQDPPEPPESPDADELAAHDLSVGEVERWVRVQERVADAFEEDPELPGRVQDKVEEMGPGAGGILSLDEQAEVVESEEAYVEAVQAEGMEPREFARTAMVFSGAYYLYEVEEAGEPREMYEQEFPWVTDEHVAFVRENEEELEPLLQRYMEATQRMQGADPEAAPPEGDPGDPEPPL